MTPFVVTGTVRARKPKSSVVGYAVEARLLREAPSEAGATDAIRVPASGVARLGEDGAFTIEVGGAGAPLEPVLLTVSAPNGVVVERRELTLEDAASRLRLRIVTLPLLSIAPDDDPARGTRVRLTGQVVDAEGRELTAGLPVVIWGVDRAAGAADPPARPLVVTVTQTGGAFAGDWVSDQLRRAYGRISGGAAVPIPIDDDGRLPLHVLLVIDVDDLPAPQPPDTPDEDCACDDTAPPIADQADVTANPGAFSQDLGGGCVDLTMPNRAIEEFTYQFAIRTTEPAVRGATLNDRVTVPAVLLGDLLGVAIASDALMGRLRGTAVTALAATSEPVQLDVASARQLVRGDQPPAVASVARAAWLSEVGWTKAVLDSGMRLSSGRTVLDADNPIDWDDTPTIHLSIELAHGHLLRYREVWRAAGYSLGDILYSLPLAPGQRRRIAVVDWDRRTGAERTESLESEEQLDALVTRDRDVLEIVGSQLNEETSGGSRNTTWGVAGGIGGGFIGSGFGIFAGVAGGGGGSDSSSWQRSSRELAADSLQSLRDRVAQRSSAVRGVRSSVVQTVSQGETLRAETEVIANYNRCHSVTVEYFEVLRHFLVTHELSDVQECLFVPLPMTQFDRGKALRWREPLHRYLREPALRGGFAAIERAADGWVGWDMPTARYSEEAPDVLEGELRISFVLPRPRDAADGAFQVDTWRPVAPFLDVDPLELFTARLNALAARERDRVFRETIAPRIAENLVARMRFAYVSSDGSEIDIRLDPTLVSRYQEGVPLYVSLNPAGNLPAVRREDIAYVRIWSDAALPPDASVIVRSARVRYQTPHLRFLLVDAPRLLDDIRRGDAVLIATPVSRQELRNPRQEDIDLGDRLVAHLNEHLEYYHQAIWRSLDPQRRYLLLDAVLLPGLDSRSVASVCANELIGIAGNSLILPVAPGQRLDPTLADPGPDPDGEGGRVPSLRDAYATPPAPPLRLSVPTRGVFAEAVAGSCNSCEQIDDRRFWRWTTEGMLAPPEIAPVSTETREDEEPDLTPTPLPSPLVSIQNAPAVPDPFGLTAAFQLLSRPDLFRDITGLEGTQRNAQAAFQAALSAASALGGEAAKLAGQQELGRNAERMLSRIEQARQDDLLTPQTAEDLASSALRGLIGESRPAAQSPTGNPAVQKVVGEAAQSEQAEITVSTPDETVDIAFSGQQPAVGAAAAPQVFDISEFVSQDIIIETPTPMAAPNRLVRRRVNRFAAVDAAFGGRATDLESRGLARRNPARPLRIQLQRRLRIVYPADPATPDVVAGAGRLPVAVLLHGHHESWEIGDVPNHEGYTYLQEELARRGIVSVSVDTNAANLFRSLVEMRAEMVFGALDRMRALNADATSRFAGRLDLARVGLMGHSRGGDAVVRVAELNARRPAATRFGIAAVCSLAPTDFTGTLRAADRQVLSRGEAPFLAVLYGALDGDVSGADGANAFTGTGFRHYDRATCPKAMVFIDHCNHNRFNRTWAADDFGMDPADIAAGGRLLSRTDHERLAAEYVGGLFSWKLLGDLGPRGLFDNTSVNTLGAGASVQWSFGSAVRILDEFEGAAPVIGTRTLGSATVSEFAAITIGARTLGEETNHQTRVLDVLPNVPGPPPPAMILELPAGQRNWSAFDLITMRVAADFDLTSEATIVAGPLPEFVVVVVDGNNNSSVVSSAALSGPTVPRRPVFHVSDGEDCSVLRLETIRLPKALLAGIDLANVRRLEITPPAAFASHMFFDSIQLIRV